MIFEILDLRAKNLIAWSILPMLAALTNYISCQAARSSDMP